MVTAETIQQAVGILAEAARPLQIILFGSHARGEAREDSDVDFLVIEREVPSRHGEMVRLRKALLPLHIPVDVVVVSEDHFRYWSQAPGHLMYWAKQEGRVLYDAA
jgi:predicted nucleotidyltransferase